LHCSTVYMSTFDALRSLALLIPQQRGLQTPQDASET